MKEPYPRLRAALGVSTLDPNDNVTMSKLDGLMSELMAVKEDSRHVEYKDDRGHDVHLVRVPVNANDKSFYNSKDFVDTMLSINGSREADTSGSAERVTNHLIRFYKDSVLTALKKQGVPICKPISETAFVAMSQASNFKGTQETEIMKHLRDHLGKHFCPTKAKIKMFSKGHTKIKARTATVNIKGEDIEIEFSEKDCAEEFIHQIARELQARNIDPMLPLSLIDLVRYSRLVPWRGKSVVYHRKRLEGHAFCINPFFCYGMVPSPMPGKLILRMRILSCAEGLLHQLLMLMMLSAVALLIKHT